MRLDYALVFLSLTLICAPLTHADEQSWDLANPAATLRDWEIISGDWAFRGGWWEVQSRGDTPGIAVIKEEVAKPLGLFTHDGMICEVTFEILAEQGNQFIIFAYSPEVDKDYVFQAGQRAEGAPGRWSIERMHIHPDNANRFRAAEFFGFKKDGDVRGKREFRFKLEIQGDTIITYHNDKELNQFTFGEDRPNFEPGGAAQLARLLALIRKMPVGRIGLSNLNAHTRFQNFKISGPDIRSVESMSKLATSWGRIKALRNRIGSRDKEP
jgi:hypothetical protein